MDITHKTALNIHQLKHIVTDKRFRELTGNIPVEDLSQATAAPVEAHLQQLHEWYADFANMILAFIEESNPRGLHNPQGFVTSLAPVLTDRISYHLWEKDLGKTAVPAST